MNNMVRLLLLCFLLGAPCASLHFLCAESGRKLKSLLDWSSEIGG